MAVKIMICYRKKLSQRSLNEALVSASRIHAFGGYIGIGYGVVTGYNFRHTRRQEILIPNYSNNDNQRGEQTNDPVIDQNP